MCLARHMTKEQESSNIVYPHLVPLGSTWISLAAAAAERRRLDSLTFQYNNPKSTDPPARLNGVKMELSIMLIVC